jgi:hypothetical protein
MAEAVSRALAANAVADFRGAVADDVVAPGADEGGQEGRGFDPFFHNGVIVSGLASLADQRPFPQLDLRLMGVVASAVSADAFLAPIQCCAATAARSAFTWRERERVPGRDGDG